MAEPRDLTGHTFGQLRVKRRAPNMGQKSAWVCVCRCGKELAVRADNLTGGYQISCGCVRSPKQEAKNAKKRKISVAYAKEGALHELDRPTAQPLEVDPEAAIDLARALGLQ